MKIRVEPSIDHVDFMGENCGGWGKNNSFCCVFSWTKCHGDRHEGCGGHHKCKYVFRPFLMFMANTMRHVVVATSLGLCLQTSFFFSGGFHACLIMAWAMEVSASVFLPLFSIFCHFVWFLHKSSLTRKLLEMCIHHKHNTTKCNKLMTKHVQIESEQTIFFGVIKLCHT